MWRVDNQTQYGVRGSFVRDERGREVWVVAVRSTFDVHGESLTPSPDQREPCLQPEYVGTPGVSSLTHDTDLLHAKAGTDVVVSGSACSGSRRPTLAMDIELQVANVNKRLRVFGDRQWRRSPIGLVPSEPVPFTRMPIIYERSSGGRNLAARADDLGAVDVRNPIGVGFCDDAASLLGQPLPNIENPHDLIKNWRDRPDPVGLGPLDRHWHPRVAADLAGRGASTSEQAQYLAQFNNAAPLDQQVGTWLTGGESVSLSGMSEVGPLRFHLPPTRFGFRTLISEGYEFHEAKMHTLSIDAESRQVSTVWVTALDVQGREHDLERTLVYEKIRIERSVG